jgi:hypothetical protein
MALFTKLPVLSITFKDVDSSKNYIGPDLSNYDGGVEFCSELGIIKFKYDINVAGFLKFQKGAGIDVDGNINAGWYLDSSLDINCTGNVTVRDNVISRKSILVGGNLTLGSNLKAGKDARIGNNITVGGSISIRGLFEYGGILTFVNVIKADSFTPTNINSTLSITANDQSSASTQVILHT